MLKTVEALFVVVLVFTTLYSVQTFIQLPSPRLASSVGQQELATTILKSLDNDGTLTNATFAKGDKWSPEILKSIDSSLPSNTIYRLTAYKIEYNTTTGKLEYIANKTGPNNTGLFPSGGITSSYTVTSPDVTVTQTPDKIRAKNGSITLYILNCGDANGWWITGFTGSTLANDVYQTMSPYFETTILVNDTIQLNKLLSGSTISPDPNEHLRNAVLINTFGESIPIPAAKAAAYGSDLNQYPFLIGKKSNQYNWTWVSIVGYPFYYVSNTGYFNGTGDTNGWGIYGMKPLGSTGLIAFLQGIDNRTYTSSGTRSPTGTTGTTSPWTNPTFAYGDDSQYATATANNRIQTYSTYGYSLDATDGIDVYIRLHAWASTTGQKIKLEVYDGTSWYTVATQDLATSQTEYSFKVTGLTSWTSDKLSKIQTRVTSILNSGTIYLDWIPVDVTPWITQSLGVVSYTDLLKGDMDYYGIYPGQYQTATRALPKQDLSRYHMIDFSDIFLSVPVGGIDYYAGATWAHQVSGVTKGVFMAIGLARTPDIRVALIGLLDYYHPVLLRSEFSASGTTRVIELQIGQLGAS